MLDLTSENLPKPRALAEHFTRALMSTRQRWPLGPNVTSDDNDGGGGDKSGSGPGLICNDRGARQTECLRHSVYLGAGSEGRSEEETRVPVEICVPISIIYIYVCICRRTHDGTVRDQSIVYYTRIVYVNRTLTRKHLYTRPRTYSPHFGKRLLNGF